ncbi:hypothetical protein OIU74_007738 [Salix koriyanagi]|uniref:Uncharacterized protein n=1 Tax=Salix koriyanagi TaxID=2511006 RepID=A0A9Q0Z6K7_9ROSI|nr:hypothetical protein OIU74_007738 [Salix koriyanagi]
MPNRSKMPTPHNTQPQYHTSASNWHRNL